MEDETNAKVFFPTSRQFVLEHMVNVLRELHHREMGPVIVFSFEMEMCTDLLRALVERLEAAEAAYRTTDEFASYAATIARNAAAAEAQRRQRLSTMKQKKLTKDEDGNVTRNERDMDMAEDAAGAGGGGEGIALIEGETVVPEVLPEFTFVVPNRAIDVEVVQRALQDCEEGGGGDNLLGRAIRRGLGLHHAGLKGKVRRQMEVLFRGRHCGVIFATETLALGVHSPCRAVVLAGDHVRLNTTQFRQMMGRAGRRGLDFLGHLVFLGISMKKITRLMTSGETIIKGNVQVDALTQLRVLQLHDYLQHRGRDAKQSDIIRRLLSLHNPDWESHITSMV
uniref:Putative helicase C694.02 n=1 Tax=Lygus hesperus TaxID=30085 RepID=A0A0A9W3W3_LYGHE